MAHDGRTFTSWAHDGRTVGARWARDAARRCPTLFDAARRCSTLLVAARRCSTLRAAGAARARRGGAATRQRPRVGRGAPRAVAARGEHAVRGRSLRAVNTFLVRFFLITFLQREPVRSDACGSRDQQGLAQLTMHALSHADNSSFVLVSRSIISFHSGPATLLLNKSFSTGASAAAMASAPRYVITATRCTGAFGYPLRPEMLTKRAGDPLLRPPAILCRRSRPEQLPGRLPRWA
jgi:hypothetical protein